MFLIAAYAYNSNFYFDVDYGAQQMQTIYLLLTYLSSDGLPQSVYIVLFISSNLR